MTFRCKLQAASYKLPTPGRPPLENDVENSGRVKAKKKQSDGLGYNKTKASTPLFQESMYLTDDKTWGDLIQGPRNEEKHNLVGGPGPRQGSGPTSGAAESVEEVDSTNDGRVRRSTINR